MTCKVVVMVEMVATEEAVEVNSVEVDIGWKFKIDGNLDDMQMEI